MPRLALRGFVVVQPAMSVHAFVKGLVPLIVIVCLGASFALIAKIVRQGKALLGR